MADTTTAVSEVQTAEWWNLVAKLRAASTELDAVLGKLRTQESVARSKPELSAEYDSLMGRAASLRNTISDYLSKLSGVVDWARDAGDWIMRATGLQGLGVVPVIIGVAAIAAAVAGVTKFLTDAYALSRKLDEQQRVEQIARASGMSPIEAAREASGIVERTAGGSVMSTMFKAAAPFLAIAGLVWLIQRQRNAQ
jgi:hypothetical protein